MSEALLTVTGLRVSYDDAPVLHGIDLTIRRGEVVAVVGESGSGKSTLAHAIVGLLPAGGSLDGGAITFSGERIDRAPRRRLQQLRGAHIGVVPQDPTASLNPVRRIGDQVGEALRLHRRATRRSAPTLAVQVLRDADVDRPQMRAGQRPDQLSGGQRQRVLIGMALACDPELLIADEPTSALDVTVQKRVLDHLDKRVAQAGASVLFITHDLGVAADRADRVVVMRQGVVVEHGPTDQVLRSPQHAYTRELLEAAPSLHRPRNRPAPAADDTPPIVAVRDVSRRFPAPGAPAFTAVDGASFDVRSGQTTALVGESGSGKSTIARIAAGLERPSAGSVVFDGDDIAGLRRGARRAFRRRVQFVHQNPYSALDPSISIGDIVAEPLRSFGIGDRRGRARRVAELLDQVALPSSAAGRRPRELSGGQRQRVAIARSLAPEPDVVILDEPVSALDVSVQSRILALLDDLQRDLGVAYLFISHDLAVVREISDTVAVMQAGRIVETGDAATLFETPAHPYTRELRDAVPGARATDAPVPPAP